MDSKLGIGAAQWAAGLQIDGMHVSQDHAFVLRAKQTVVAQSSLYTLTFVILSRAAHCAADVCEQNDRTTYMSTNAAHWARQILFG